MDCTCLTLTGVVMQRWMSRTISTSLTAQGSTHANSMSAGTTGAIPMVVKSWTQKTGIIQTHERRSKWQ